jgi:pyrroline-5-carboxylate reductase
MSASASSGERIAFIGGGRMAEAMVQGLLSHRLLAPDRLVVCDVAADRRRHLGGTYGVRTTADGAEAAQGASVTVLAIKPQHLAGALTRLRGRLPADALVLSIVTGARAAELCARLQHERVVRAMPNIPAQVGMSATVWWATDAVPPALRERARVLLGAVGLERAVDHEEEVDMATGLTGPAPAFLFLFIEAMVEAGVHLGFARDAALALTLQSIEGSVALMKETGDHPAVLRGHVTSPGGATAAGLLALEKAGLRAAIVEAVRAAFGRARELGASGSDRP